MRSEELADLQVRRPDFLDQRKMRVGDADVVEGEANAEGAKLFDRFEEGRSLAKLLLLLFTGLPILTLLELLGGVDPNMVIAGAVKSMWGPPTTRRAR